MSPAYPGPPYADAVTPTTRTLVVKATSGADRPELVNQAFTVAASAVAAGVEVSLWLTGEAAWLAVPGRAAEVALEHAAPLEDLLATVLEAGSVTVCTQCAARRDLTEADLVPGVRIAGSAVFVEEILDARARSIVY